MSGAAAVTDLSLILFDLNGVLYQYDRTIRINHLAQRVNRSPQAVEAAIFASGFEDSGDAGALDADAYLSGYAARLGTGLTETDWLAALRASVTPIPRALALLPRIRPDITCAVLTNNNLLVRRHFATLFPEIAALVGNRAFVSASFQCRKPDPGVYRRCLDALGVLPKAALFIDDSAANVQGARAAGLAGYHAQKTSGLTREFRRRGLIDRSE